MWPWWPMMDIDGFQCFPLPKSQGRNRKPYKTHQKKNWLFVWIVLFCSGFFSTEKIPNDAKCLFPPSLCQVEQSQVEGVAWWGRLCNVSATRLTLVEMEGACRRGSKGQVHDPVTARCHREPYLENEWFLMISWYFLYLPIIFNVFFKYPYRINQILYSIYQYPKQFITVP